MRCLPGPLSLLEGPPTDEARRRTECHRGMKFRLARVPGALPRLISGDRRPSGLSSVRDSTIWTLIRRMTGACADAKQHRGSTARERRGAYRRTRSAFAVRVCPAQGAETAGEPAVDMRPRPSPGDRLAFAAVRHCRKNWSATLSLSCSPVAEAGCNGDRGTRATGAMDRPTMDRRPRLPHATRRPRPAGEA